VLSGTSAMSSVEILSVRLELKPTILADDWERLILILTVAVAGPALSTLLQAENSRTSNKILNNVMTLGINSFEFFLIMFV